jgi:hypothetical protein
MGVIMTKTWWCYWRNDLETAAAAGSVFFVGEAGLTAIRKLMEEDGVLEQYTFARLKMEQL